MVAAIVILIILIVLFGSIAAGRMIKIVQQYEQGIIYRWGRVLPGTRGPGLTIIRPIGDRMQKVNMQIVAMAVPAQEGITRDNVSVRVDAVVYFRVVDPIKATINVQNYMFAVSQQAATSLRSIIGQSEMDQLLAERETINRELRRIIDEPTEGPWGIRVERVEIKDVSLPEGMKRSMSAQAEAERARRARIINADAEYQASKRLAAAANIMARDPAALQLRLLETVRDVASERNSTLVMPVPVELLRFFDKFGAGQGSGGGSGGSGGDDSLADFGGDDIEKEEAEIESGAPLSIPDVPSIPELPQEISGHTGAPAVDAPGASAAGFAPQDAAAVPQPQGAAGSQPGPANLLPGAGGLPQGAGGVPQPGAVGVPQGAAGPQPGGVSLQPGAAGLLPAAGGVPLPGAVGMPQGAAGPQPGGVSLQPGAAGLLPAAGGVPQPGAVGVPQGAAGPQPGAAGVPQGADAAPATGGSAMPDQPTMQLRHYPPRPE